MHSQFRGVLLLVKYIFCLKINESFFFKSKANNWIENEENIGAICV